MRKVAREKARILKQLEAAVRPNDSGPVIGGGNIHYEIADKTGAITHGGIGGRGTGIGYQVTNTGKKQSPMGSD